MTGFMLHPRAWRTIVDGIRKGETKRKAPNSLDKRRGCDRALSKSLPSMPWIRDVGSKSRKLEVGDAVHVVVEVDRCGRQSQAF